MRIAEEVLNYLSNQTLSEVDMAKLAAIVCELSREHLGGENILSVLHEIGQLANNSPRHLVYFARSLLNRSRRGFKLLHVRVKLDEYDTADIYLSTGDLLLLFNQQWEVGGLLAARKIQTGLATAGLMDDYRRWSMLLHLAILRSDPDIEASGDCPKFEPTEQEQDFIEWFNALAIAHPDFVDARESTRLWVNKVGAELFNAFLDLSEEFYCESQLEGGALLELEDVQANPFSLPDVEEHFGGIAVPINPAPVKAKGARKTKRERVTAEEIDARLGQCIVHVRKHNPLWLIVEFLQAEGFDISKISSDVVPDEVWEKCAKKILGEQNPTIWEELFDAIVNSPFVDIVDRRKEGGPAVGAFAQLLSGESMIGSNYQWLLSHTSILQAYHLVQLTRLLDDKFLSVFHLYTIGRLNNNPYEFYFDKRFSDRLSRAVLFWFFVRYKVTDPILLKDICREDFVYTDSIGDVLQAIVDTLRNLLTQFGAETDKCHSDLMLCRQLENYFFRSLLACLGFDSIFTNYRFKKKYILSCEVLPDETVVLWGNGVPVLKKILEFFVHGTALFGSEWRELGLTHRYFVELLASFNTSYEVIKSKLFGSESDPQTIYRVRLKLHSAIKLCDTVYSCGHKIWLMQRNAPKSLPADFLAVWDE